MKVHITYDESTVIPSYSIMKKDEMYPHAYDEVPEEILKRFDRALEEMIEASEDLEKYME